MIIDSNTSSKEVKEKMVSTLEKICNIESSSEKSTTGDTIRKIMRLNTSRVSFNEYDFIRLFLAKLVEHGVVKIDTSTLGYELIEFYRNSRYYDLFDMPIKKQVEGDFVDVSSCIQQAILGGILSAHEIQNTTERLILLSNNDIKEIINSYEEKYNSKMEDMVNKYLFMHRFVKLHEACKSNPQIQLNTDGKTIINQFNPEYIVNHFAEDGFVEKFCLSTEEKEKVKSLRLEAAKTINYTK